MRCQRMGPYNLAQAPHPSLYASPLEKSLTVVFTSAGQQAPSAQQLEQQRQQVRASILGQMGAPQGGQQPAYANESRYVTSSLPSLNGNAGGKRCFTSEMLFWTLYG